MAEHYSPLLPGYRYVIRVKEHIDTDWSAWLEGLTISRDAEGETVLEGIVADQSMLYGLLAKLHNLNLSLISLQRLEPVVDAAAAGESQEQAQINPENVAGDT